VSGFDPIRALGVLTRFHVRFIVIGGFAGRLWGSPTITNDIDVCADWAMDNLERLAAALVELRARLRGVEDDVPLLLDARTLKAGRNFTFMTDAGALDVLAEPSGRLPYEDLEGRAHQLEVADGLTVAVVDLEDLVALKRAAGRPKDQIEVHILEAVREELQGR
jgi:hypothetical protein